MSMIGVSDGIALAAVVLIGLPHGAFDGAVYQLWQGQPRLSGYVRFIISYLALAGVFIGLWLVFPVLSLFGFLLLSAYHFGVGDSNAAKSSLKAVQIICHGGLATIWLMTTHQTDAARIFEVLSGAGTAILWDITPLGLLIWGGAALVYGASAWQDSAVRGRFGEFIGLAVVMAILPLLPAFALYFCAIHSRRHFAHIWHRYQAAKQGSPLGLALLFTLTSWAGGGGALWLLWDSQALAEVALQIIFIGLAALTVPHMILVDGLWRRRHAKEDSA